MCDLYFGAFHAALVFLLQVANEPVQCAQKTEKGLSGYAYNKQTGLVNKVCMPHPVLLLFTASLFQSVHRVVSHVLQYWKRRWCELVGSQMTMYTLLPSVCTLVDSWLCFSSTDSRTGRVAAET